MADCVSTSIPTTRQLINYIVIEILKNISGVGINIEFYHVTYLSDSTSESRPKSEYQKDVQVYKKINDHRVVEPPLFACNLQIDKGYPSGFEMWRTDLDISLWFEIFGRILKRKPTNQPNKDPIYRTITITKDYTLVTKESQKDDIQPTDSIIGIKGRDYPGGRDYYNLGLYQAFLLIVLGGYVIEKMDDKDPRQDFSKDWEKGLERIKVGGAGTKFCIPIPEIAYKPPNRWWCEPDSRRPYKEYRFIKVSYHTVSYIHQDRASTCLLYTSPSPRDS